MKAIMQRISKSGYRVFMDNEARRAIRFCCGFNTDLRIKIRGEQCIEALMNFIEKNRAGIFGVEMNLVIPDMLTETDEFDSWCRAFRYAAHIVAGLYKE